MNKLNRFEVAARLGITTRTLRRLNNVGKLVPKRDASNRPFYTKNQIDEFLKNTYKPKYKIIWISSTLDETKVKKIKKKFSNNYLLLRSPNNMVIGKDKQFEKIITLAFSSQLAKLVVCEENLINKQGLEILKVFLKKLNTNVISIDCRKN
ncbi:MerR family transcriptional regulator [Lactobacillus crispatus]|nr:MerR family transcriptional regulator [Lactobacillus crispatus]STX18326.1 resolvase [Lactobacillus acidophilus]MCT7731004.1 helix-turn-helix domain-containing protein [Lactobacillus crispatus]MCT7802085.1 helix-turn-helix domain-containing protein [Lactobacillus crispatus]MCT7807597.1 helix-turn-helix domain-containing protein [Lactobacillus crispatus]MCT7815727.1 helix-turn-helix domain-containing protein [Lactobacillus crispatus]